MARAPIPSLSVARQRAHGTGFDEILSFAKDGGRRPRTSRSQDGRVSIYQGSGLPMLLGSFSKVVDDRFFPPITGPVAIAAASRNQAV